MTKVNDRGIDEEVIVIHHPPGALTISRGTNRRSAISKLSNEIGKNFQFELSEGNLLSNLAEAPVSMSLRSKKQKSFDKTSKPQMNYSPDSQREVKTSQKDRRKTNKLVEIYIRETSQSISSQKDRTEHESRELETTSQVLQQLHRIESNMEAQRDMQERLESKIGEVKKELKRQRAI